MKPFADAVELLKSEIQAAVARCERIGIERELAEEHRDIRHRIGIVGEVEATADEDARRRLGVARAAEQASRATLEARLEATQKQGHLLGLDAVCKQHGLTEQERTILVLACIPAISREMASCFDGISRWGGCDALSLDASATYVEADFAGRIALRGLLTAQAPLVRQGLVSIDIGRTADPADWPDAAIRITARAFAAITGTDEHDPGQPCSTCGQMLP